MSAERVAPNPLATLARTLIDDADHYIAADDDTLYIAPQIDGLAYDDCIAVPLEKVRRALAMIALEKSLSAAETAIAEDLIYAEPAPPAPPLPERTPATPPPPPPDDGAHEELVEEIAARPPWQDV